MPRRNRRDNPVQPLPSRDDLSIPLTYEQHEAQREAKSEEQWARRRASEDEKIRRTRHCVWPGCEKPILFVNIDNRPLPLCSGHSFAAWSRYAEIGDKPRMTEAQFQWRMRRQRQWEHHEAREESDRISRGTQPGWIYYIQIDDKIKIGYSIDVKQRMRAYPPDAKLLAVHPGTKTLEVELHRQFTGSRAAGREWFYPHDDLIAHITQAVEQFGDPSPFAYKYRKPTGQVTHKRHRAKRY